MDYRHLKAALKNDWSGRPGVDVHPTFEDPPASHVQPLGQPAVVNELIGRDTPAANSFSQSDIMRKYYHLKNGGRLSELTLEDGIILARTLVEASIAMLPPSAGVGGSVDVLTVTREGKKWISKKSISAAQPPPYGGRQFNVTLAAPKTEIDGLNCVHCTFEKDVELLYQGTADVQLVRPRFERTCKLVLAAGARHTMPQTVERLVNGLRDNCEVIEDGLATSTPVLRPDQVPARSDSRATQPAINPYAGLNNRQLHDKAVILVTNLRAFSNETRSNERAFRDREWSIIMAATTSEQRAILDLKFEYATLDVMEEASQHYKSLFEQEVNF